MADGGAASNDDTAIVFTLGDMGTFGIYDAEGGLSTELGHGVGALGVGGDYANTMTESVGVETFQLTRTLHTQHQLVNSFRCASFNWIRS